jgi:hypothetical protein
MLNKLINLSEIVVAGITLTKHFRNNVRRMQHPFDNKTGLLLFTCKDLFIKDCFRKN